MSFGGVTVTSELNADPLTFTVTCTSMNGPVTSVDWTVDDTTTGAYTLTLSVTGRLTGTYNCTVTSVRPEGIRFSPGMHITSAEMMVSGECSSVYHINSLALTLNPVMV